MRDATRQAANGQRWLGVIVALQVLVLWGQWAGPGTYGTPAMAQPADPGAQRAALVEEQRKTNDKLDKLIALLESGKLQVRAVVPDEGKQGK